MAGECVILVTGATGTVGSELVRRLTDAGERVRALSRDPDRASKLLPDGVEVVRGDLADQASLRAALAGVSRAYLLSGGPQQAHLERGFVEVARETGLQHLIKHSAQAVGF